MGTFSRLDAVNHMLLMSGEHIVNHLEDDSGVDTSVAEHILDETITSYVMRGLVNNSYYKKYQPNSQGYVYLPSDTLHAELCEPIWSKDRDQYVLASYKGSPPYLFNVTDHTADWTDKGGSDGILIMLITDLEWSDIETPMQRGIMSSAARDYQMITQGDHNVDKYLAQREITYMSKGRASDITNKKRSFLGQDPGTFLASTRDYSFRDPRRRYR